MLFEPIGGNIKKKKKERKIKGTKKYTLKNGANTNKEIVII